MGEAKGHRIRLGRAGKCESVTGKIGGDGWAGIRVNIERERGKKKKPRKSRERRMEFRQGVGKKIEGKAREKGSSLGNIEELLKKKREGSEEEKKDGEEGRCFQRSKKTVRSPLKGGGERERGEGCGKWDRGGMKGYGGDKRDDGEDVGESEKGDEGAEGG